MTSFILKLSPITRALTRYSPQKSLSHFDRLAVVIHYTKWNDVVEATNLKSWDLSEIRNLLEKG